MVRQFVEEHTSPGPQDPYFGDGQGGQEVGQATNTGGAQPRTERDTAARSRGNGTRIEHLAGDRELGLVQQASATR
jgi:hypothetical protein